MALKKMFIDYDKEFDIFFIKKDVQGILYGTESKDTPNIELFTSLNTQDGEVYGLQIQDFSKMDKNEIKVLIDFIEN